LRHKHPAKLRRPLRQPIVVELRRSVFLRRQHVYRAHSHCGRDGASYVYIHVFGARENLPTPAFQK
jgi:hypothetical protein